MAAAASSTSSSLSSVYDVSEEKTNGTRLTRLLIDGGTHVLRKLLHSIYPPATLQLVLNKNRLKLQSLKSRRVIFDSQWQKLFPPSGDPPVSKTFDISLLHLLIREICHLTPPVTGWHKMPAEDDESLEANIARIKCFRNELCHGNSTSIPNGEFEKKWKQLSSSLEALELHAYRRRIERLKGDPIDHDIERRLEEEVNQWEELDNELALFETEKKVPSCLPDELPEELLFGRKQEIQQVIEAIQSGSVSVVWITGGPGFGKTTVASKAAHELTRLESERVVLFCSLRSKATLHDAATLMTLACSKNQTQPPENPEHWLLNWSKQQVSNVTFVLDNADEVLEHCDCKEFMNLLEEMRTFSRQTVTCMITSRKAFSTTSLQIKIVRLAPLPVEEAKRILLSRVPDLENQKKLSKAERLVELCGFVPLALCIAGSLLSDDYNEDEFIRSLEEEPSDVLQVGRRSTDQTSVEKSIKSSFEVLDELEQKALVLLCVFPGSFNSDAAKSLIADFTTSSESVSVLRELKDRSLVEQLRPRRYQVHQLIQTFVQKIASDKYPELLNRGKKLACAHFMSRLADNAKLYWGKDTCKQSVELFNEDRHNFEHFLQIYVQGRKNQDSEIVVASQTFLEHFPQKFMYLEKCVLPRFYVSILEMLLETFDAETQPVHRVELLCLLGHESRKQGDKEKYQKLMGEAEKVHSKNHAEFKTKFLSKVYFHNSFARFLSDKKDPDKNKRREQETETALKVCRGNLGDHPETAATLLLAGIIAKRRKERGEAEQKLSDALELFQECLGKHFMTAETLKAIADLFFFLGETEVDSEVCLARYKDAMEMFDNLGMSENKESVLTLKNFGVCHRKRNNFNEAMEFLTKAERVSEQELEGDHTWKVSIKTELATLHYEMGNSKQAIAVMLEGLRMANRIELPIDKMGNKNDIRRFINIYPDIFPENEFPRGVGVSNNPPPSNVLTDDDSWTAVGRDPRNPPVHCEKVLRGGSRRHGAQERSTSIRYSLLAEEENVPAATRQKEFGDYVHQEPLSTSSRAGRPENVQSGAEEELPVRSETQPKLPKYYSNKPLGQRGRGNRAWPISTSNRYSALAEEGNHPAAIGQKDVGKKTVLHETRKGSQCLTDAVQSVGKVISKEKKTVFQKTKRGNQCLTDESGVESVEIMTRTGGMIVAKGVQVECPPGAINKSDSPLTIKITVEEPSKHYGLIVRKGLQNDVVFGAPIIHLQPSGQQFRKPVIMTIKLDEFEENCTNELVILHGTKSGNGKVIWQDVSHNSSINAEKGELKVEIDRFSLIVVLNRLLKKTLILTKDIVSRFNLLSFNYTLTVLFKENFPYPRHGELALVFMSQDIHQEDYYREHENSALVKLKHDGFLEVCSRDGRESNNVYNSENLKVSVQLGDDYQLADSPPEGFLSLPVDSLVWWSTGHIIKLRLQGSEKIRILCGRISVHGQYGQDSEYHFCEQDLGGYVRRLLEVEGTICNLKPVGKKLGLSEETTNEVMASCKDEEEQLKVMLRHLHRGQDDAEDPAALRKTLEGLKPQDCRVKERGQMHIHHLRELSNRILDTNHMDPELVKYFTDQVRNLCASVLRDCCIEIGHVKDDLDTSAPPHVQMKNAASVLEVHQKISNEDARKYQQMCSSSSKPLTENFLLIVPFLVQTIKEIFLDEGISHMQNGLWGLPESTVHQLASNVLGAVQNRNISKVAGEVLNILEQLCLANKGDRSTEEIKQWGSGGGMLYMLKVLERFFTSCEERKLYKRLHDFSGFMKQILLDPTAFDEVSIRDVHNVSLSLVKFAKFDPTKLVRFELVDSVTNSPIKDNSEDVKYDDQGSFSQQFLIRKQTDDELQLDAKAFVHLDGMVCQVGAFRSEIFLPAASKEAFERCQISDLPVAVQTQAESEKLRVVLCGTRRENVLMALDVLKARLGEDEINWQQTEITASPLTMLTTAQEGSVVSLRLVYKWSSKTIALESKDFVALVESSPSAGACEPWNLRMEDSSSSMEDNLSTGIVPLPRDVNLQMLQRQLHGEGGPREIHFHMHRTIQKGHICVAGENTSLNMQMPNTDHSHPQALPSLSPQRSIEEPRSDEDTL